MASQLNVTSLACVIDFKSISRHSFRLTCVCVFVCERVAHILSISRGVFFKDDRMEDDMEITAIKPCMYRNSNRKRLKERERERENALKKTVNINQFQSMDRSFFLSCFHDNDADFHL